MTIPILMYHQIDPPPARGAAMRALVVSPAAFARQMGLLKLLGYRGLALRELEPYLRGEKHGKVVGLTFDDGYQNNLLHALPVLKRYGFSATCYAVSNAIGGTNQWDAGLGVPVKPLMTAQEWRSWHQQGMEVGSHTCDHVDLRQCSAAEAARQITQSRHDMEQLVGCEVRHFCYPYGWYLPEHAHMVANAGYAGATTTQRGRARAGDNLFALKRIKIARATSLPVFAAKILSQYEDRRP